MGALVLKIFALVSIYVEPLRFTRLWLCRRPSASDGPKTVAWAGDTCTAMDEPTSLKFVNRRIGELTKKYAAAQTHARTSAIFEELSQLSIVRDELKKTQRKIYTAEQPTERPKMETLFREMDKLARQMTETRRENRDRSEIVNEITRLSFLADSLSKSKNSQ